VLDDGNAVYTPGVSEKRGSMTTFSHSGLKNAGAQTDAPAFGDPGIQSAREYDAFGSPTASSGSWQGPFGYAGQFGYQGSAPADPLGGLMLLGHRYYDPSTGRFLTRDPIGDGSNWFAYCGNSPVGSADPNGLKKIVAYYYRVFQPPPVTPIPMPGPPFVRPGPPLPTPMHIGLAVTDIDGSTRYFAGGPEFPGFKTHGYGRLRNQRGSPGDNGQEDMGIRHRSEGGVVLVDDDQPAKAVLVLLDSVSNSMDSRGVPYDPFGDNSNSWATLLISRLGLRDEFTKAMLKRYTAGEKALFAPGMWRNPWNM
jgi:RHS repeat-associated protein